MREIVFRGKSTHSDEWCFGNLVDYGDGEVEIQGFDVFREGIDDWKEIKVDSKTVGQFTGLLDANGKEIYEGDIIKSPSKNIRHFINYNESRGAFTATLINKYMNDDCGLKTECNVEQDWLCRTKKTVVGNIHDNPELLRGGKDA